MQQSAASASAPQLEVGGEGLLVWAALVAGTIACLVPLGIGIAQGWSPARTALYVTLALLFVGLSQLPRLRSAWACRLLERHALLMSLFAALGLTLQILSGDPFLQPMVFTVPIVFATLAYPNRAAVWICVAFLGLMGLGLWLGGNRYPPALIFPILGYASAMVVIFAFTRLSIEQTAARQYADALAADLARQRDALARLVDGTAALARELHAPQVVEQIGTIGAELAAAGSARVWLAGDPDEPEPRLAFATAERMPDAPAGVLEALGGSTVVAEAQRLSVPLVFQAHTLGVLELEAPEGVVFRQSDAQLLLPFASAAAVALENARLYEQARQSATLAERNRLARELHDTIAQGLMAINLQLEAAGRAFDRDPARARGRMTRAAEITRATLVDVRRSVWTLAAPLVDGRSLHAALESAVDTFVARTAIRTQLTRSGQEPRLDSAVATQIVRIVQEALHNVEKHANATHVEVQLELDAARLRIAVIDDGRGFMPGTQGDPVLHGGFGLMSQRERARLAGGTLTLDSAPGQGTRLALDIPATLIHDEEVG